MRSVLWVIQSNLTSADDVAKLTAFLDRQGTPWVPLRVIPFDDTPPDVAWDGPVVFYGSTTLTKTVSAAGRWTPGVFFEPARFAFEALRAGYGERLLNVDSEVLTIRELVARPYAATAEFFVRPAADMKEFTGEVLDFASIREWQQRLQSSRGPLSLDTRVQLAAPKAIGREWRTIVVDGRVVAASQYRALGRFDMRGEVPKDVLAYAEDAARAYQPAPVFVLDVWETAAGLRVGETNCFNASGWYWCDVHAIVREVTAFVARRYGGAFDAARGPG